MYILVAIATIDHKFHIACIALLNGIGDKNDKMGDGL